MVTAQEKLDQAEQERSEVEQVKQTVDRELEQARMDVDGLASTGADAEAAMGLMAIMVVVGGSCVLLRRRLN